MLTFIVQSWRYFGLLTLAPLNLIYLAVYSFVYSNVDVKIKNLLEIIVIDGFFEESE
jgi:hypothetical protein